MFDAFSALTSIQKLLVLIPALPLLAAVLTAALGPKLLRERSHWPTIAALIGSFFLSLFLLLEVRYEAASAARSSLDTSIGWEEVVNLWTWADVTGAQTRPEGTSLDFDIAIAMRVDPLTSIMLCMVTFVASLVAIYSAGYMHGERGYWRFFAYVSLFVFSMTMLVSVSNFLLLYVFWEAVGACSYLLIGFWYEKPSAAAAGKKAFLVNRVGDFCFAIALFLIWTTYGTLNFHDTDVPGVLGQLRLASPETMYVGGGIGLAICLLLMAGACGKSAQFPLHVWLPDAMEGPTPVSALIHAATMVTAGVYMVTRCTPLFMVSHEAQLTVAVIGGITLLMAGLIAITQNDLKRVLAYSTVSQLGYMFLALGTGTLAGIGAGMFHLFTHAFFKALLFLGAGSVMHAMGGVVDMRRFGGLRKLMPWTHATFFIGCLALSGIWPFAGFWSKDAILHAVEHVADHEGPYSAIYGWLYTAGKFTALLTAFYTFRAFFLSFYGAERIPPEAGHHAHESPSSMTLPLVILALFAAGIGLIHPGFAALLGETPSLAYAPIVQTGPGYVPLDFTAIAIGTGTALVGVALAAFFYLGDLKEITLVTRMIQPLYRLSEGKFFIDQIYTLLVVWPLLGIAHLSAWFDRNVIDMLVNFTGQVPVFLGGRIRWLQSGLVQNYAMLMVLGLLLLMGAMIW